MSVFKKNWTLDETERLLEIVKEQNTLQPVGNKKYRSIKAFENVSNEMEVRFGYIRRPEQIRAKLKSLRREFYLASKKPVEEARTECALFDVLKELLPSSPCRFVEAALSDAKEIPASVPISEPVQQCKKTCSSPLISNPRKKKRLNLENTVMSLVKDFMQQQKSSPKNLVSGNQNKPEADMFSSDEESFDRPIEPYADLRVRRHKSESEESNSNFLKSLLPDLNKLSEQRQRLFKQRALVYLYKLLEDEEADRANMKEQTYHGGSSPQSQIYLEQSHNTSPDQSSFNPVTVALKIDKYEIGSSVENKL